MSYYKAKVPEAYARVQWCKETFGPSMQGIPAGQRKWTDMRWYRNKGYLYFKHQEDYFVYVLRWGHG
jgi:hypothetical protein